MKIKPSHVSIPFHNVTIRFTRGEGEFVHDFSQIPQYISGKIISKIIIFYYIYRFL